MLFCVIYVLKLCMERNVKFYMDLSLEVANWCHLGTFEPISYRWILFNHKLIYNKFRDSLHIKFQNWYQSVCNWKYTKNLNKMEQTNHTIKYRNLKASYQLWSNQTNTATLTEVHNLVIKMYVCLFWELYIYMFLKNIKILASIF